MADVKEYQFEDIVIKIDHDKCTGCGDCIDSCPTDVFEMKDDKSTAPEVEECIECCACVDACPEEAIEHGSC